ncbi:MAG TPA: outer membrane protein assembly factor BamC [Burkholderiales bacterium]|jgi:outer membrane protein assembly factor BamC|nr:outer membrane protein assembly factor BamC [Burkholderiales bacterium]
MRRFAAAAAVALAGCSTSMFDSSVDYKTASQLPPLEIPPDLTAPQRDGRFVLPDQKSATLSGYQQERKEQGRPGAAGVLPQVENVRLERLGAERWLVVQEPPDKVWPVVREFWLERGFLIKQETPEIGVLETDWAENRANLPQDGIRGLLGRFADSVYSTSERDKFRTRLERTPDGNGTEIYISHRGMQEVYTISQNRSEGQTGQTYWQPRPSDPGLEAEFLRRLMVRLGSSDERSKVAAAAGPTPDRAAIVKSSDGTQALQVNEPFDRAWRRVGLALDRVGFTVEDRDRQNGLYFVRYADPESEMAKKDNEKGLFSRLFGSSDAKVKAEQYRVQVKPENEASTVNVLNKDGGAETNPTAQRILVLLHEQLK